MRFLYLSCLLLLLFPSLARAQEVNNSVADPLFPNLEQALYQDAAHAYDDAFVVVLSRKHTARLQSRLIPVQRGATIDFDTYVHYTKGKAKTWQKIGAAAAGLAIGSLPYLLDRSGSEGNTTPDLLKTVGPLAGAGVASLPFVLDQRRAQSPSTGFSLPTGKNGWSVPDAYLRYNVYDSKGYLLDSKVQMIDKQAKDAWQRLSVHEEVQQDGYVLIELGNQSKRPVWLDGFEVAIQEASKVSGNIQELAKETSEGFNPRDTTGGFDQPVPGPINNQCITEPCGSPEDDDNEAGGDDHWTIKSGNGTQSNPYVIGKDVYVLDELEVKPKPVQNNTNNNQPTPSQPAYRPSSYDNHYNYSYPDGYYASDYGGGGGGGSNPGGGGNDPCVGPNPPITCFVDGNLPHPGKLNWDTMSSNQKIAHIIKAIQYAKQKGISVNLNEYFTKLPRTGNTGFGKQYRISGSVRINGVSIPISVEVPVNISERVFNPTPIDDNRLYDPGATYGPYTRYYYYGLGNRHKNSAKIFFSEEYDDIST